MLIYKYTHIYIYIYIYIYINIYIYTHIHVYIYMCKAAGEHCAAAPREYLARVGQRRCREFSIYGQVLRRNVKWFRGGLVFKAHRFVHRSTVGWRVIKKKRRAAAREVVYSV